jgi:hypothetical protein
MATLNSSFGIANAPALAAQFMLRVGQRELVVTRDFRKRYYAVNPIIECDTGVDAGHLEILLCKRWLLVLSKAH